MGRYRDPAEAAIWCRRKEYKIPILHCLKCGRFPCAGFPDGAMAALEASAFVEIRLEGFAARRVLMHVFRKTDGSLVDAPEDFDPDRPDGKLLEDVEEVLVVGKVLVKQLRLVPRPREEIRAIREELSTPDAEPAAADASEPTGRSRKRGGSRSGD